MKVKGEAFRNQPNIEKEYLHFKHVGVVRYGEKRRLKEATKILENFDMAFLDLGLRREKDLCCLSWNITRDVARNKREREREGE